MNVNVFHLTDLACQSSHEFGGWILGFYLKDFACHLREMSGLWIWEAF